MNTPRAVAIFGSSATRPDTPEWVDAETSGRLCAEAGMAVVTGGYGGTMEAACKGANEAGGEAIGVTAAALFPDRPGPNRYVTREIETSTLFERIDILTSIAGGVIALPGSLGTAAELIVSWNLNHVSRLNGSRRLPTVAVGEEWLQLWRLLTGTIGASGQDVHHADTAFEAVDWLLAQPELK